MRKKYGEKSAADEENHKANWWKGTSLKEKSPRGLDAF